MLRRTRFRRRAFSNAGPKAQNSTTCSIQWVAAPHMELTARWRPSVPAVTTFKLHQKTSLRTLVSKVRVSLYKYLIKWRYTNISSSSSSLLLLLSLLRLLYWLLQDLVNSCKRRGTKLEEWFVAILSIHLIDIVDWMHRCHIIHADFKPDNVLLTDLWAITSIVVLTRTRTLTLVRLGRMMQVLFVSFQSGCSPFLYSYLRHWTVFPIAEPTN